MVQWFFEKKGSQDAAALASAIVSHLRSDETGRTAAHALRGTRDPDVDNMIRWMTAPENISSCKFLPTFLQFIGYFDPEGEARIRKLNNEGANDWIPLGPVVTKDASDNDTDADADTEVGFRVFTWFFKKKGC